MKSTTKVIAAAPKPIGNSVFKVSSFLCYNDRSGKEKTLAKIVHPDRKIHIPIVPVALARIVMC